MQFSTWNLEITKKLWRKHFFVVKLSISSRNKIINKIFPMIFDLGQLRRYPLPQWPKNNLNESTYIFWMIELQSRAIKVALMPQGGINPQMSKGLRAGFQKGWLLSPFLSLSIAKDREILVIGMENRQRDSFFESLVKGFAVV